MVFVSVQVSYPKHSCFVFDTLTFVFSLQTPFDTWRFFKIVKSVVVHSSIFLPGIFFSFRGKHKLKFASNLKMALFSFMDRYPSCYIAKSEVWNITFSQSWLYLHSSHKSVFLRATPYNRFLCSPILHNNDLWCILKHKPSCIQSLCHNSRLFSTIWFLNKLWNYFQVFPSPWKKSDFEENKRIREYKENQFKCIC